MATRAPLTLAEKERIYAEKIRGRSLGAIATDVGCARETARKWWRVARDHGRVAFRQSRRGRAPTGVLSHFPPAVTQPALALKHEHPAWGPDRVLTDLGCDPTLTGQPLPSRSRLAVLFKTSCPQLVAAPRPRTPPASGAARADRGTRMLATGLPGSHPTRR